ncbi:MAG: hypothetical protein ACO1Q7_04370 [Gemmatimonas sp.]
MIRLHAISRRDGGEHDGIHLLWSPPFPSGHSLDGFTVYRRDALGRKDQHCFALSMAQLEQARTHGHVTVADATIWARPDANSSANRGRWTYRVVLNRRHSQITVSGGPALAVFAGLADGTVIAGTGFVAPSVTLRGSDIGVLWLVSDNTKNEFQICGDVLRESAWNGARVIVKNLQVPFASVNSALSSVSDEQALAKNRAEPDALAGEFDEISRYANAALVRPDGVPAWRVVAEKQEEDSDAWDVSPFGLAIVPTILPAWHRALGFAHIDRAGLSTGASYDYRIVGTVRRRDRDERLYDLHTVPRNYRLPRCFRWGTATVWTNRSAIVTVVSSAGSKPTTVRKGFKTRRLVVLPDTPTPSLIVESLPGATFQARGTRFGLPIGEVSGATSNRTRIDFGAPVDRIVIEGLDVVMGIVPKPLDAAMDPDEKVEISQTIFGVQYVPTAGPLTPGSITVQNLSDPARTAVRGVLDTNRGFEIAWEAPPAIPAVALPHFPVDATSAPPTEVARYRLERSWRGLPFEPNTKDGIQISGRNAPTPTDSPAWGFDLLKAFPPVDAAPGSYATLVKAIETFEANVLEYGDDITYRVMSVDATGRESTPQTSAPTPLRKFVRPPVPGTPPATGPVDPDAVPPSGIQVRLLQHDNPDLSADDRPLVANGDVVTLRWGWGPEQRGLDPDVAEFRVYEHDHALTEIRGRTTGAATSSGGGWTLPVQFDQPVAANEFGGVVLVLDTAFRIIGHAAGENVVLSLAANAVNSAVVPGAGEFVINRTTSQELNSEYWNHRVQTVARTPVAEGSDEIENYEVVLPAEWIAVTSALPRQKHAIGVTSADAELYVADRRIGLEPNPRLGNESTVAAVEVIAKYYGRPVLTIADLTDVPKVELPRQGGEEVHGVFRPASFLPPGFAPGSRMLLERIAAESVLARLTVSDAAIQLLSANGTSISWTLSAADQAAIRAEDAAGAISDRFLAHAATRLDGLEAASTPLGVVDPAQPFTDTLPNRPSRWLYRLRAVDIAGRPSSQGQLLPVVVHVPSPARSIAPEVESVSVSGSVATIRVRARGGDGETVYVFTKAGSSFVGAKASLATIRNRTDLPSEARLVVRDDAGLRLMPTLVSPDSSGVAVASIPVAAGAISIHVWAVSMTADGVPSRLVGPVNAAALERED